jgi:hypothetical protein
VFAAALPVTRTLEVEAIMSTGREASSAMSIYPNPVADRMTIAASRFNRQSSVQVALVDAYGREVVCEALWVNDDHKIDLSVSLLTDGVYILHVKQGAIEFRSRIVKIR